MNNETLSKIQFAHMGIKRILIFNSFRQFLSYSICASIAYIITVTVSSMMSHKVDRLSVLVACFLGAATAVLISLKTEFSYSGTRINEIREIIKHKVLISNRYKIESDEQDVTIMSQQLPRILTWDENKVFLEKSKDGIRFKGPWLVAQSCHRAIAETIER